MAVVTKIVEAVPEPEAAAHNGSAKKSHVKKRKAEESESEEEETARAPTLNASDHKREKEQEKRLLKEKRKEYMDNIKIALNTVAVTRTREIYSVQDKAARAKLLASQSPFYTPHPKNLDAREIVRNGIRWLLHQGRDVMNKLDKHSEFTDPLANFTPGEPTVDPATEKFVLDMRHFVYWALPEANSGMPAYDPRKPNGPQTMDTQHNLNDV